MNTERMLHQTHLLKTYLEEFKNAYRNTRNYTLLSEKHDDASIFGGLVYGSGFACVYSAWQVFMEVKLAYVVPDTFSQKLDLVLNRSSDHQHTGDTKVVVMKSRKTTQGIESNLVRKFYL